MSKRLELRLLGHPELQWEGAPLADMHASKTLALLSYLVVTGRPQTRSTLAGLLWGGRSEARARGNLSKALSTLRQVVGDHLIITRQTITFEPGDNFWSDVAEFEAGMNDNSIEHLQKAVQLYKGDFLEGFYVRHAPEFEDWVMAWQVRLKGLVLQALHTLATHFAERGKAGRGQAIAYTSYLLTLEPWQEEAHRRLMRLLALNGQRGAALAQYEICRQVLLKELEIEPTSETRTLAEKIRAGTLEIPDSVPIQPQNTPATLPAFLDLQDESATDEAAGDQRPFVARELELSQLDNFFERALTGQGQVVFVIGDPGSGKTALIQEFSQRILATQPRLISAWGNCNAFTGIGDPYLPFREILALLTGDVEARWVAGAISREQARRLWNIIPLMVQILLNGGPDLLDIFISGPALVQRAAIAATAEANWLSRLQEIVSRQQATRSGPANLQQTNLFEQYTNVLQALAQQHPLLLVLDDLQWADAGSINLLFHLGRRLKGQRILIVGSYRLADVALGRPATDSSEQARHPLEPVINEFQRNFGQIQINLTQTGGRPFIKALLNREPHRLEAGFQEVLYQHTQGHALFTIEMLQGMQERGNLVQDEQGRWREGPTLDWETLPARVEGIIGERIGRLPLKLQELLKIASVEGEIFTAEVVAQVQGLDETEGIRQLSSRLNMQHRLVQSHNSSHLAAGRQRLFRYRFRHILFQKYLYSSLDEAERVYLHQAVGNALEQLYDGKSEEVAVQLARHFQMAGSIVKAVGYLQQTGERAVRLSAYHEAIVHFKKALALLETLPDPSQHAQLELKLLIALGQALIVVKGAATTEIEFPFRRAHILSQQVGDNAQLFQVFWGLFTVSALQGDMRQGYEMAEQFLHLAQSRQDSTLLIGAHTALGNALLYLGEELASAQAHLEQGLTLYERQKNNAFTSLYRQDPGLLCHRYLAWTKWFQGYPNQASQQLRNVLNLAQKLAHPLRIAEAQATACMLYFFHREDQAVKIWSEKNINLSTEHGFKDWTLHGTIFQGWASTEQGRVEEGIEQMRQGLDAWYATGARWLGPLYLSMLAEAHWKLGQTTEGLAILKNAQAEVEETGERFWEAELYRLNGELLIVEGAGEKEIDACLHQAVDTARRQHSKLLELRATVSLCRLWQAHGKKEEAGQMLADIYGWFSEGFDTLDLKEAQALLEELS